MKYVTTIGERSYHIEVLDEHHLLLDGKPYDVNFTAVGNQPVFSLILNGQSIEAHATPLKEGWQILLHGKMFEARVEDEQAIRARSFARPVAPDTGEFLLRAPMPGLIVGLPVSVGQEVEKGTALVILESMKMQNDLRSNKSGVVQEIKVKPGQAVDQNQVLVIVK